MLKPITAIRRLAERTRLALRLSLYLHYAPRRAWAVARREG